MGRFTSFNLSVFLIIDAVCVGEIYMREYIPSSMPKYLFFQTIAVNLLLFQRYKNSLKMGREKKDANAIQDATQVLTLIANAVSILLDHVVHDDRMPEGARRVGMDFEKDTWFFPEIEEHCKVYAFNINPRELISDILSEQYKENLTMQ